MSGLSNGGGHPIDPGGGRKPTTTTTATTTTTTSVAGRSLQELSPTARQLRDRVSFFERVWTSGASGVDSPAPGVVEDIEAYEQRFRHTNTPPVSYDHTPCENPARIAGKKRDGSFEELCSKRSATARSPTPSAGFLEHERHQPGRYSPTRTTFEETIHETTSSRTPSDDALSPYYKTTGMTSRRTLTGSSRTPSEEVLDSAYQTQWSSGPPKTSATSSGNLSRFTSDESLKRTPSRDRVDVLTSATGGASDGGGSSTSGSRVMSSSEWYSEYRSSSFQHTSNRDYFRSKSEYDDHIATIRGRG